jgi:hypothetical protein
MIKNENELKILFNLEFPTKNCKVRIILHKVKSFDCTSRLLLNYNFIENCMQTQKY